MKSQQTFQITVQGRLDQHWRDWFNGMILQIEELDHTTRITIRVPDQAALCMVLNRLWDLNLALISLSGAQADGKAQTQETDGGSNTHRRKT